MRTRREFGQLIFGGSSSIPTAQRYGVYGGGNASCQRGTTTKDSWEPSPGKYRTEILIDGNDTPGEYNCDMPIASGTRVVVLMFSTQAVILPISSLILDAASQDAAAQDADVRKDLSDEITKRGEVIKADAVQDSKLYTDQTVNSLSTTIADTYQSKSDMGSYATTSDLTQTSEEITATFTQSLATKGRTYVGQPTPPYYEGDVWIDAENGVAYECASTRESGSYSQSDWSASKSFVSTIIRNSVNGVEVGKVDSGYKTRLSAYSMDVLNGSGNSVASYGDIARIGLENSTNIQVSSDGIDFDKNGNTALRISQNLGSSYIKAVGSAGMNVGCFDKGTGVLILGSHDSAAVLHNYDKTFKDSSSSYMDYSTTALLGASRLYQNGSGTQGSFTLSIDASYFSFLEFVYGDGSRIMTKRIYNPDGETFAIDRTVYSSANTELHIGVNVYSISGKAVNLVSANSGGGIFSTSSNYILSDQNYFLRVYQVIGWR